MIEVQQVRDGLSQIRERLDAVAVEAAQEPGDWTDIAETLEGLASLAVGLTVKAWLVAGEQADAERVDAG